ncbi:MAG: hypothetical protein A2V66_06950 [Ignavibacteria bacterium RBG_13_36_8]|nr:MAG: hypothetical protein A2V66_06950 [Ignavibacteria bacterium RBG_13_36_8]
MNNLYKELSKNLYESKMITNKIFLFLVFTLALLVSRCEKDISTTPPDNSVYNGKILFDSNPQGAQIFLNGDNTGKTTPDSIAYLEPGIYSTTYRLSPYLDIVDTVEVEEGNPTFFYKNFFEDSRNFGELMCYSEPSGALISINDSSTGLYTPALLELLWPGIHKVTCSYPEHRNAIKYITVYGGESKTASFYPQDTSICVDYNYSNSEFPAVHTSCVAVDHNNVIWIGNYPGGIVKIENGIWSFLNPSNSNLVDNSITCIEVDNQNNKWFGTSTGVVRIDADNNMAIFTHVGNSQFDNIMAINCDNDGNTWIASTNYNTRRKLWKYDGTNWTDWDFPTGRVIVSLETDLEDRLWIGRDQGLVVFENGEYVTPPGNYTESDAMIKTYSIESIAVDELGLIWIGTGSPLSGPGGLFIFDGVNYNQITLPRNYISHINIDYNGNKWISCHGKYPNATITNTTPVLIKINPEYNITSYTIESTKIASGLLKWSATETNGNVWIASRDKGIIKFKVANL